RCSVEISSFASTISVVGASAPRLNLSSKISYPTREGMSSGNDFIVLYSYVIVNTFAAVSSKKIKIVTTDITGLRTTNEPTLLHNEDVRTPSSPTRGIFGQNALLPNNVNNVGISVTAALMTTTTAILKIGAKVI